MIKIYKNTEPQSLTQYRSKINKENLEDANIYNDFPDKTKDACKENKSFNLRKQLLDEQGHVCCYCMSRISCDNSKIEHFKSQDNFRNLQINYQNLFISCSGGEGLKAHSQTCDTKKGEQELNHIDLFTNIENKISYKKESSGIIVDSTNKNIKNEITNILNLNTSILNKNRKEQYDNIMERLKQKGFTVPNIKKIIEYYKTKHNEKFEPFYQMVVYFLTKKLKAQGVTV